MREIDYPRFLTIIKTNVKIDIYYNSRISVPLQNRNAGAKRHVIRHNFGNVNRTLFPNTDEAHKGHKVLLEE